MLSINPAVEENRIVKFIKQTFKKQGPTKAVIGLSGGVDSATSYVLLSRAIGEDNVIATHLPYFLSDPHLDKITKKVTPYSIKKPVDAIKNLLGITNKEKVRLGNVMARVRMSVLFDLAKKHRALVCGTENKTEHLLGYFTRYGDGASDIEPLRHLYKTQVYILASYLGIPKEILQKSPTAGLWPGQTDEKEFGFTYKEADEVLHLYFDEKKSVSTINKDGFKNAGNIIRKARISAFKHAVPYSLDEGSF